MVAFNGLLSMVEHFPFPSIGDSYLSLDSKVAIIVFERIRTLGGVVHGSISIYLKIENEDVSIMLLIPFSLPVLSLDEVTLD